MVLFALVPGLPFLPFCAGGLALGVAAWMIHRKRQRSATEADAVSQAQPPSAPSLGDVLDLDDVHVEFAADLVDMALDPGTGLDARIANMRTHVASVFGMILPEIRLTDRQDLEPGTYVIRIQGVEQARGALHPNMVLALKPSDPSALPAGTDVTEPVYGAPARWIPEKDREQAVLNGATAVTPPEILATHLLEIIKSNFSRLLTLKSLRRLLAEMTQLSDPGRSEANRKLLDELIPDKVPIDVLHSVLRLLLDEKISIRNLALILEAIAEARVLTSQPEAICEHVRQRLGFQLVAELKRPDGSIPLVQLAPDWEECFESYQVDSRTGGLDVALPPDLFNRLADSMARTLDEIGTTGQFAAVVTTSRRRRFLRTVLRTRGVQNPVLSFEEIGLEARPAMVGMVAA
jgi:flagellar biosynthesis protein FlhA